MDTHLLQDWITVNGTSTVTSITQVETAYLDAEPYQDVMVFVDVRQFTGTAPTINVETAPIKDESLFSAMFSENVSVLGNVLLVWKITLSSKPSVPVARWVRWRCSATAGAAWSITFRILVSGNALGT
jgi:hypothetical protein